MAQATPQGAQLLNGWRRMTRFSKGLGAQLPEAYKKFWREWKQTQPAAVHYIPKDGEWERDEVTNEVKPVQNIPLPLYDPPESNDGIWGGEAVIKGFQKRNQYKRRVPHFWVPNLRRSVVYSKILNEYMSMVVTDRTIEKIHDSLGFDHYILKNRACDLRSTLALKLKRKILLELLNGCPKYVQNPKEQKSILTEYKCYLEGYSPEEIDWYGYTFNEAIRKMQKIIREQNPIIPHKVEFRSKLIQQLRMAGITEAGIAPTTTTTTNATINAGTSTTGATPSETDADVESLTKIKNAKSSGWFSKINPFGKSNPQN